MTLTLSPLGHVYLKIDVDALPTNEVDVPIIVDSHDRSYVPLSLAT